MNASRLHDTCEFGDFFRDFPEKSLGAVNVQVATLKQNWKSISKVA
jgi:hypothetical protein